jgi:hypothetical protein
VDGGSITEAALERRPNARVATLDGNDPLAHLPGWLVPNVLGVTAFELGHPLSLVILVETDDSLCHHAANDA